MQAFSINLTLKQTAIKTIDKDTLKEIKKVFKDKGLSVKNNYDYKIFNSEIEAEFFLKNYLRAEKNLKNIKKVDDCPNMIYKRRYLIQTLMSEKNQTIRSYKKDWKKGQIVNLYDQTYYVPVKIKSIKKVKDSYVYSFELAS